MGRGDDGFRFRQIGELRSRRTKLRWGSWLLFLAALCKLGVFLISIALEEGSITFLTFPLTAIAFAMTRHELDAVNASLHALIATDDEPGRYRKPVRWLPVFVIGSVLFALAILILIAAASRSDDETQERVEASRTEANVDRSPPIDPADAAATNQASTTATAAPTTTTTTTTPEPSLLPGQTLCDSLVRSAGGDGGECVWAAAPDVSVEIDEWDCSGESTKTFFTLPAAEQDGTEWFRGTGESWRRIQRSELGNEIDGACLPEDHNPFLPPFGKPGIDGQVFFTKTDPANGAQELWAVSLLSGIERRVLFSEPGYRLSSLQVAPDENRLAFILGRGTNLGDLYVSDADGTSPLLVSADALVASSFAWAGSDALVADVVVLDTAVVTLLDLSTGDRTPLSPPDAVSRVVGVQNGVIVFATVLGPGEGRAGEREPTRFTAVAQDTLAEIASFDVPEVTGEPMLLADGESIVFRATGINDPETDFSVLQLNATGASVRLLEYPRHRESFEVLGPDATWMAFVADPAQGDPFVVIQAPQTVSSRSRITTTNMGIPGSIQWAPDGSGVIVEVFAQRFDTSPGTGELVFIALDGSTMSLGVEGSPIAALG